MTEKHAAHAKHAQKHRPHGEKFSFRRGMAVAALVGMTGSWALGTLAKEYYLDYGDIVVDNDTVHYYDEAGGSQTDGYEDHLGEIVITQITEESVSNTLTIISGEELDAENEVEPVTEEMPEENAPEPVAGVDEPSADPAPADEPSGDEPSADPAPVDEPSADEPSADPAPTDEPSGDEPSADPAPVDEPSGDDPSADPAPADEPSADAPSADPAPADEPETEQENTPTLPEQKPTESTAAPAVQPAVQPTAAQPVAVANEETDEETPQATEPEEKKTVTVTIKDVNIDVSGHQEEDIFAALHDTAAITIKGDGDVVLELAGNNTAIGGGTGWNESRKGSHAGVEKNDSVSSGALTIQDKEGDGSVGSLTAVGGKQIELENFQGVITNPSWGGAGIGSSGMEGTSNIHIKSGIINATGGQGAAGIGSGGNDTISGDSNGVKNILISGGDITATAGLGTDPEWQRFLWDADRKRVAVSGAGIGSGVYGNVEDITITGGNIKATGMCGGAGIGSGYSWGKSNGDVKNITITGGTIEASARGQLPEAEEIEMYDDSAGEVFGDYMSDLGCGIGGGNGSIVENITITGGNIRATSQLVGAGIGAAGYGVGVKNITISGGTVEASSKDGVGIGGDSGGAENILIKGGTVKASGGGGYAAIGAHNTVIEGGTVDAAVTWFPYKVYGVIGGPYDDPEIRNLYGAAIGGDLYYATRGTITIKGGTVTANGYDGQTHTLTGVDSNFLEGQRSENKFGEMGGIDGGKYEINWENGAIIREKTEQDRSCTHEWGLPYVDVKASCQVRGLLAEDCTKCEAVRRTIIPIQDHSWNDGSVTTPPTCTAVGEKTYTCMECGKTKPEPVNSYGGHKLNDGSVTREPTCTVEGEWTRSCTNPGCNYAEASPIAKAEHSWGEMSVTKAPTCTEAGEESRSCTVCGAKDADTVRPVAALGHKMERSEITTPPTCTTAGVRTYYCVNGVCQHTETAPVAPLEHDWGEWMVSKPATVLEEGEEIRVCKHDAKHVETRPVAKLPPVEESNSAESRMLRVDSLLGQSLRYRQELKDGCVVITAPEQVQDAVLYGPLACLAELEASGAKTLVFRTRNFESRVSIRALLACGEEEDTFALTHKDQQSCLVVAGRWAGELIAEAKVR